MQYNINHNTKIIESLYDKLNASAIELDRPKKAITEIGCDLLRTAAIEAYFKAAVEYKNVIKYTIMGVC